ncbi:MAG TPA: hypothetical protein VFP84_10815 [Kofleriaceae bacterium]|nr:hypothetical protein [Kofleriaceae bacterium]
MSKPFIFRPSFWWPALVIAIIAGELGLGWHVYHHTHDGWAVMLALAGVPVLAAIDYLARLPHPKPLPGMLPAPRWYRRYLALWCLVPFMSALAGSFWVHYQKRLEAIDDIRQVALDVKREVSAARNKGWGRWAVDDRVAAALAVLEPGGTDDDPLHALAGASGLTCRADATTVTAGDINHSVIAMFAQRFSSATENEQIEPLKGESEMVSEQARRFTDLARVIGRDLRLSCGDVDLVAGNAAADTWLNFGLALAIQALFVLWIPVLLAITTAGCYDQNRLAAPAGIARSLHSRDLQILAEHHCLFVPRFCFGVLIVLGTNYVFSPFGLKATYIMNLVDEHALPGHSTWVLWSTSFASVPVLVVGFVGFLLYALVAASQRFSLRDLDDRAVLSLLIRGLVVILLCFALSSSPMNETVSRIFVFIAGVFPTRALEALAKKVNVAIDPDFDSTVSSFDGLPSLDPTKVFALRSAGIQSTYDLAAMPIDMIAERVRIDPYLLGRAVDRAILIDAIGLPVARRLEPFAITSATELVALKDHMPELVESSPPTTGDAAAGQSGQLREVAERVAKRLADDLRVIQVRTWLAGRAGPDGI